MQRRLFLFAALPIALLTTAVAAPGKVPVAPAASGVASRPGTLATGLVSVRDVQDTYAADAVIEAVRQATVSAQIAGTVTQLYVDAGDRVRRGQVLARIDTRDTDAQVNAGRAGVAQADAAVNQAKLNFERTERLVKQGFISQAALDKADADLKTALAALEVARAGSTQAVTARSFAELRAPIDGVVSQRLMELGELAAPGKPVLTLHDPAQLRAVGAVPQFVLPKVAAARAAGATTAQVDLPSLARQLTSTRVTVLPTADARLLSTVVRAELGDAAAAGLVPGTAAKILLPVGQAKKLVMPAAAVLRRGELVGAYVVGADGRPQLRQIRVGEAVASDFIEVLAGVADGERVALDPLAAGGALR